MQDTALVTGSSTDPDVPYVISRRRPVATANTRWVPEKEAGDLLELIDRGRPAWQKQAACRGLGADRWFEIEHGTEGKAICAVCPVNLECREAGRREHFGTWGGIVRDDKQDRAVDDADELAQQIHFADLELRILDFVERHPFEFTASDLAVKHIRGDKNKILTTIHRLVEEGRFTVRVGAKEVTALNYGISYTSTRPSKRIGPREQAASDETAS